MALTAQQKRILYITLPRIMASEKKMADLFYVHLFAVMPESEALFKTEHMVKQKRMFMRTISRAVTLLDQPHIFELEVKTLAKRHENYGVTVEQFFKTKTVLLQAIEESLGDEYTPIVGEAWSALYDHIMVVFLKLANIPTSHDDDQIAP